jgi:hypothetical protein
VRSVTVLPRPAYPKKVGSARSEASGSPRPKALALHVDDDTADYYTREGSIAGRARVVRAEVSACLGPRVGGRLAPSRPPGARPL